MSLNSEKNGIIVFFFHIRLITSRLNWVITKPLILDSNSPLQPEIIDRSFDKSSQGGIFEKNVSNFRATFWQLQTEDT